MPDVLAIPAFASADEPVLTILLYLDDVKEFKDHNYMPMHLEKVLAASGMRVDIRDRTHDREINAKLLDLYHEVWFFLTSRNVAEQLTDAECLALREWMDHGGGVLITGDHAEVNDAGGFEGLGRPIGRRIPRARHMRVWDGPPGGERKYGKIDSTEISAGRMTDSRTLERDATPQRLLLPLDPAGAPHMLFLDANNLLLDRLPDHRHEGKVIIPAALADEPNPIPAHTEEWAESRLVPEIIARGVDWRRGACFDLMAAWDGHLVPSKKKASDGSSHVCGRILADSSWHHYIDDNLDKIAAVPDNGEWVNIQAIYLNIAAWLAPPSIQQIYRERAYKWAAERVGAIDGVSDDQLGVTTLKLFAELLPGAWYYQLIDDRLAEHAAASKQVLPRKSVAPLIGATMRRRITG